MKRHTIQLLAILASLTASSNAAISFTETFSNNPAGPGPNMSLVLPSFGSPTTDFVDDFTITSGPNSRIYLGTSGTDYSTVNFTFEVDVTIPDNTDPWAIAFIGMGTGEATGVSGEPTTTTGAHIVMGVRHDENTLVFRNGGGPQPTVTSVVSRNGTRGLRLDWNAATNTATFMFDINNDGDYTDPTDMQTVLSSTGPFNASNSRLFVGGGSGLIFDNISVSVIPEPSAALLGCLGVLGLLRRRRI